MSQVTSLTLLLTSFLFGLRHGVDWDHVAAIAGLSHSATDRRQGFLLSIFYAIGHAVVVLALGSILIVAGASIPASLDEWMGRIVGATLVALGLGVLWDLRRNDGPPRLRSRWMLLSQGRLGGLRRLLHHRDRSSIDNKGSRCHQQDQGYDYMEAPDAPIVGHAPHDELATASTPAGLRARHEMSPQHCPRRPPRHVHGIDLPQDGASVGPGVATGIGMLHGIGIESPTQIAIFITSTSVVGRVGGLMLLGAWVAGLVIANAVLALVAGAGVFRPDSNARTMRAVAIVVATMSIALGARYLFG